MNNLAQCYQFGFGTERDFNMAEKYYLMAIQLGNEVAKKIMILSKLRKK